MGNWCGRCCGCCDDDDGKASVAPKAAPAPAQATAPAVSASADRSKNAVPPTKTAAGADRRTHSSAEATAGSHADSPLTVRKRLLALLGRHAPTLVPDVDDLLRDHPAGEVDVVNHFARQLGPEPTAAEARRSYFVRLTPADIAFRQRLRRFLQARAPGSLPDLEALAVRFTGNEEKLISMLVARFGQEPSADGDDVVETLASLVNHRNVVSQQWHEREAQERQQRADLRDATARELAGEMAVGRSLRLIEPSTGVGAQVPTLESREHAAHHEPLHARGGESGDAGSHPASPHHTHCPPTNPLADALAFGSPAGDARVDDGTYSVASGPRPREEKGTVAGAAAVDDDLPWTSVKASTLQWLSGAGDGPAFLTPGWVASHNELEPFDRIVEEHWLHDLHTLGPYECRRDDGIGGVNTPPPLMYQELW